jgi:hypothetical protein
MVREVSKLKKQFFLPLYSSKRVWYNFIKEKIFQVRNLLSELILITRLLFLKEVFIKINQYFKTNGLIDFLHDCYFLETSFLEAP